MTTPTPPDILQAGNPAIGPRDLFIAFSQLALSGFGGVLPFAYRILVERKQWLAPAEFAELLALAQILPGPTICNLAMMIGYRHAGTPGSLAALCGMMAAPIVIVITLGMVYQHYSNLLIVRHALTGMSAVAAGLVAATAIKMGKGLPRRWLPVLLAALAFGGVGVMRWPLLTVIGVLAPLAVWLSWRADDGGPRP